MTEPPPLPASPGFNAPLGAVADWRLIVTYDAARSTGLLDALPATVEAAARATGLAPPAVRAVLDLLVAGGVAGRHGQMVSAANPAPGSLAAAQIAQHASAIRRWSTGLDARLRGEAGGDDGPFPLKEWLTSMAANAERQADAVAAVVTDRIGGGAGRRALDLGGGHGRYARTLAALGFEVVMMDRPEVLAVVDEQGWLDGTGVQAVAGDFHDELPSGRYDVVLALGIMHTMSPERAASFLVRVAERLTPDGIVVIRTVLRDTSPTSPVFAVHMLAAGRGGDTHRLADYQQWFAAAGLGPPEPIALETGSLLVAGRG